MRKHIVIIGAGPGGLAAALLLAHQGHRVEVFEKADRVGGRNAALTLGAYTFDTGPTFHLMPQVLEQVMATAGKKVSDYLTLKRLDPLYRLSFYGKPDFYPCVDKQEMIQRIEELFPGDGAGFEKYLRTEERRTRHLVPCLEVPYNHIYHYLRLRLLKATPFLDLHRSVYSVVSRYFKHEEMRIAATFQAKYLGMSPWQCPGTFAFLSYMEHAWGIYHCMGGLHKISEALAKAAQEEGAKIHLSSPVREIIIHKRQAKGIQLASGERVDADAIVLNADFAHAMKTLIPETERRYYTNKNLAKKKYSCSTFMLYLGIDKQYDVPHHNIVFARDYRKSIEDISRGLLSDDFSFYVQNASATDPSLAPPGHSTLYVLVPVPNTHTGQWTEDDKKDLTEKVLDALETRGKFAHLRKHITTMHAVSPLDWEGHDIYAGAVFNLAHTPRQMLYLRPRNKFEEFQNCYLVGGGTHPGSGLPTILQSALICARMLKSA